MLALASLGGAASAATLRSQGLGARELCAAPQHCEPWGITPMKVRRAQSQRPSRNSVLTDQSDLSATADSCLEPRALTCRTRLRSKGRRVRVLQRLPRAKVLGFRWRIDSLIAYTPGKIIDV